MFRCGRNGLTIILLTLVTLTRLSLILAPLVVRVTTWTWLLRLMLMAFRMILLMVVAMTSRCCGLVLIVWFVVLVRILTHRTNIRVTLVLRKTWNCFLRRLHFIFRVIRFRLGILRIGVIVVLVLLFTLTCFLLIVLIIALMSPIVMVCIIRMVRLRWLKNRKYLRGGRNTVTYTVSVKGCTYKAATKHPVESGHDPLMHLEESCKSTPEDVKG